MWEQGICGRSSLKFLVDMCTLHCGLPVVFEVESEGEEDNG